MEETSDLILLYALFFRNGIKKEKIMIENLINIESRLKTFNEFLNCEYYRVNFKSNDVEELFGFYLNYSFYYVLIKKSLNETRKIYLDNKNNSLSLLIISLGKNLKDIDLYYSILLCPLEDYYKYEILDLTLKDYKEMINEFDKRVRYSIPLIIQNIEYLITYIKGEQKNDFINN